MCRRTASTGIAKFGSKRPATRRRYITTRLPSRILGTYQRACTKGSFGDGSDGDRECARYQRLCCSRDRCLRIASRWPHSTGHCACLAPVCSWSYIDHRASGVRSTVSRRKPCLELTQGTVRRQRGGGLVDRRWPTITARGPRGSGSCCLREVGGPCLRRRGGNAGSAGECRA
jgi:hypothetical protein